MVTTSMDEGQSIVKDKSAFNALCNVSAILNTGLSKEELVLCVQLCERGVNPNMLANIVKEMKKQVKTMKEQALAKKSAERGF